MLSRDYRDIIAGGLLCAFGLFSSLYASTSYNLGTFSNMGPGMFPSLLGGLLIVFGILTVVPALFRSGEAPAPDLRVAACVFLSIAVFAATINRLGLAPAALLLIVTASLSDRRLSLVGLAALSTCLIVFSVLVFIVGLRMPISIARWPF